MLVQPGLTPSICASYRVESRGCPAKQNTSYDMLLRGVAEEPMRPRGLRADTGRAGCIRRPLEQVLEDVQSGEDELHAASAVTMRTRGATWGSGGDGLLTGRGTVSMEEGWAETLAEGLRGTRTQLQVPRFRIHRRSRATSYGIWNSALLADMTF